MHLFLRAAFLASACSCGGRTGVGVTDANATGNVVPSADAGPIDASIADTSDAEMDGEGGRFGDTSSGADATTRGDAGGDDGAQSDGDVGADAGPCTTNQSCGNPILCCLRAMCGTCSH